MLSLQFLAVATLRDGTCPPIQPRPQSCRVDAPQTRTSRARYGAQSTAKGLLCTNWGGGRIERNVPIVAELSWNLYQ